MKQIFIFLLCCVFVSAYADDVKVTLKNGTALTGEMKELVATDHVTVIVGGVESVIPISEVASLEKLNDLQMSFPPINPGEELVFGKYQILDTKSYPKSFAIKIGDQELMMVLVKGGWFNMGYDGRHSRSWDSRPVHRVLVPSFYVSDQVLNRNAAETLLKKKKVSDRTKPYEFSGREEVNQAIGELVISKNAPYRLLTEAEWEYAAIMTIAPAIFGTDDFVEEWCSDHWSEFSPEDQINPQGPANGEDYVIRRYSPDNDKYERIKADKKDNAFVRIAISASEINNQ